MAPAGQPWHDLLRVLYGDERGVVDLRAISKDKQFPAQAFCAPADTHSITVFCAQHRDRELYFGVALRKDATSGELKNCATLPTLFADLDYKSFPDGEAGARAALARCPRAPTAIIASGNGLHAYWRLVEPLELPAEADGARAYLRRLALDLGSDRGSAEPAHVLRLPGTANHKYDPPRQVVLEVLDESRVYRLSDFDEWLPTLPVDTLTAAATTAVEGLIPEGMRNTTLTSLAGTMRRRGMTPSGIEAALQAENLARCIPPLPAAEVAAIARSISTKEPAGRLGANVPGQSGSSPDERAARRLSDAILHERARREARQLLDAEARGPVALPATVSLREWLAQPDASTRWRIHGWQPAGSRVMVAAQFKAGKTTLRDNLVRSLADGSPWLGAAAVAPVTGSVCVLDFEMSQRQLRSWLREQRIVHDDRVVVVPMRGQAATFDILDSVTRTRWEDLFRGQGVEYLVLDCLRPILDALGLDEHHDAGRFLVAFDALLLGANIPDALVVHHMGHTGERSRGDSRLRDWPDVEWRVVRQSDDPASVRYITAFGRDVDIPESQLTYDALTRRLTLAGGSRQEAEARRALPDVLAAIEAASEPLGVRDIQDALRDSGHSRTCVRNAAKLGIRENAITTRPGPCGKILHFRGDGHRPVCERAGACGERAGHGGEPVCDRAAAPIEPHARTVTGAPSSGRTLRFEVEP